MSDPRVIFVHHKGDVMTAAQLKAAMSALNEAHPARRALTQIFETAIGVAAGDAAEPTLDPTKGTHAGGRLDALLQMRADLEALWGQVPDDEPDDGG